MGSNTFHLLIAEMEGGQIPQMIYKERSFVHLARSGMGYIDEETQHRAIAALDQFSAKMKEYEVDEFELVGTAALRKASNSDEFRRLVEDRYGKSISIISGDLEADYIKAGVSMAAKGELPDTIIMDIGGGSVEFILVKNNQTIWQQSYPIGISEIKSKFQQNDPLTGQEVNEIYNYLNEECSDLLHKVANEGIETLTGSSGTFEVFADNVEKTELTPAFWKLDLSQTKELLAKISKMTLSEREEFPGFPTWRAALMPPAVVLIQWALDSLQSKELYYSTFALKEGKLSSLANSINIHR